MNITQWSGLIVSFIAIITAVTGGIRWLVKHYLAELKPNGGGSMNDRINRVEAKLDRLYEILVGKSID